MEIEPSYYVEFQQVDQVIMLVLCDTQIQQGIPSYFDLGLPFTMFLIPL